MPPNRAAKRDSPPQYFGTNTNKALAGLAGIHAAMLLGPLFFKTSFLQRYFLSAYCYSWIQTGYILKQKVFL